MKGPKKKSKLLSLRVYGILDKEKGEIKKVSLNKEELIFEIELDNYYGHLVLCDFDIKVKFLL